MDPHRYDRELQEVARRDRQRAASFLNKELGGAQDVPRLAHHIDGRALTPASGKYLDDLDPATGAIACRVPAGNAEDVEAAVRAAQRAFPAWAAMPLVERCAILERTADLLERDLDRLALLETQDTGKPIRLARTLDIPRAARNFRFYARFLRERKEPEFRSDGFLHTTLRSPIGVVGLVTPWNLPLYLLTWKVAPALGLGNTVVAKPSEITPQTASALADTLREAGVPGGVYNVVHGTGPEAGGPLVGHAGVRAVSFTGGTATGSLVQKAASATGIPKKLSLELGGKNPALVFADCDLDSAVAGVVRGGFTNGGQICLCTSRVLVEESILDAFLPRFVEKVQALRVGDPTDAATDVGSLSSAAHREKVERYLAIARSEGARIHCGGRRPVGTHPGGAFLEPTVLSGLAQSSRVVQEEVFGPVVTVQSFRGEEEALQLANGVRYGLTATVWTQDRAKAARVAAQLETGMVWVNCWLVRDLATAFGGVKDSGVGREGGEWSVDFYSEARNVCMPE